jgi:hypothetical protein
MPPSRLIAVAALTAGLTLPGAAPAFATDPEPPILTLPLCWTVTVDSPTTGTAPSVTVCRP